MPPDNQKKKEKKKEEEERGRFSPGDQTFMASHWQHLRLGGGQRAGRFMGGPFVN